MQTRMERTYRVCCKLFSNEIWEATTYRDLPKAIERARKLKANGFMVKVTQFDYVISENEFDCLTNEDFDADSKGQRTDVQRYLETKQGT